jgi:hypothetical protein
MLPLADLRLPGRPPGLARVIRLTRSFRIGHDSGTMCALAITRPDFRRSPRHDGLLTGKGRTSLVSKEHVSSPYEKCSKPATNNRNKPKLPERINLRRHWTTSDESDLYLLPNFKTGRIRCDPRGHVIGLSVLNLERERRCIIHSLVLFVSYFRKAGDNSLSRNTSVQPYRSINPKDTPCRKCSKTAD